MPHDLQPFKALDYQCNNSNSLIVCVSDSIDISFLGLIIYTHTHTHWHPTSQLPSLLFNSSRRSTSLTYKTSHEAWFGDSQTKQVSFSQRKRYVKRSSQGQALKSILLIILFNISQLKHTSPIPLRLCNSFLELINHGRVRPDIVMAPFTINRRQTFPNQSDVDTRQGCVSCRCCLRGIYQPKMEQGSFFMIDVGNELASFT